MDLTTTIPPKCGPRSAGALCNGTIIASLSRSSDDDSHTYVLWLPTWHRKCHVERIPLGVHHDKIWGKVTLTVPESLAHHLPERQDGQIALRLVTQGQPAACFVRESVDAHGVTSTIRFTFLVEHTCSLLSQSGNTLLTWMLQANGEVQIQFSQR